MEANISIVSTWRKAEGYRSHCLYIGICVTILGSRGPTADFKVTAPTTTTAFFLHHTDTSPEDFFLHQKKNHTFPHNQRVSHFNALCIYVYTHLVNHEQRSAEVDQKEPDGSVSAERKICKSLVCCGPICIGLQPAPYNLLFVGFHTKRNISGQSLVLIKHIFDSPVVVCV